MPLPTYEPPKHATLEPDTYDAVLLDIEERQGIGQDGQPSVFWIWTFELDNDGEKVARTAASSPRLTPKSKGGKWAACIKGSPLSFIPGEPFDWGQIIGKPCKVDVIPEQKPDGSVFDKIEAVRPAGRKRGKNLPAYEPNGEPVEDLDAPF